MTSLGVLDVFPEGSPFTAEVLGSTEFGDAFPPSLVDKDKLTSRFRGVCWNKKNRRWQAAINSAGRYHYLGSYGSEEEAARVFDLASIRLRGPRAKLNFKLEDYLTESGEVLDDERLGPLLLKVRARWGSEMSIMAGTRHKHHFWATYRSHVRMIQAYTHSIVSSMKCCCLPDLL
jgi:hypothetical protein